jgi:hypothetical protein
MQRAKEAEARVMDFLKKRPDVLGVMDWRELQVQQEADIDIAIKTRDGRITLAEIKSDSHLGVTNNVLYEVLRINHTCAHEHATTLGWSGRTPAQFILFDAISVKKIYQIRTEDFRKALQEYTRVARKNINVSIVPTDSIKTTVNILIPWNYCQKYFKIFSY